MISKHLDQNEHIVIVLRKHWFMFALQVFVLVLGVIAPLGLAAFIPPEAVESLAQLNINSTFMVFLYTLWVLALWNIGFIAWTNYFLDTWVVSNRRIVDVDQQALFRRKVTTLMLEKVQDITIDTQGIFATLLGFGTMVLHTAGAENPDIVIRYAAHPQYAKDRILDVQRKAMVSGSGNDFV
jgi:hypothetical protein